MSRIFPHQRAFTLAEVTIALALTVVFSVMALTLMQSVAETYRYHEKIQTLVGEQRHLRERLERCAYGAAFFEIYNQFTDTVAMPRMRRTSTGGTMLVLGYTDTAAYALPDNVTDLSLARAKLIPPLNRIVGFYLDDSNPGDIHLRTFDSANVSDSASPAVIAWAKKIREPSTPLIPGQLGNPGQFVSDLLPESGLMSEFPSIARVDRAVLHAKSQSESDANQNYQLFYAKNSLVLANLVLRSGSDPTTGGPAAINYEVPLTLALTLHK